MAELDRQVIATLEIFVNQYPVFAEGKPLAIGMREELTKRHPDIEPRLLRSALLKHCKRPRYLKALATEPNRYDLDGNPAGVVTEEQRDKAANDLEMHHEHEQAILRRREEIAELERQAAARRAERTERAAAKERARREAKAKKARPARDATKARSSRPMGGAGTGTPRAEGGPRQQPVIIIKKKRPTWPDRDN
ncbi:ProQ/FINO family protein [Methylomagnum sp.]